MIDERVIKSYVWHGDECFFVSTIERDSSAAFDPGRYNETIVWRHDWETNKSGPMLYQFSGARNSIRRHMLACDELFQTGKLESEEWIL